MRFNLQVLLLVCTTIFTPAVTAQQIPENELAQIPPAPPRNSEVVRKLTPAQVAAELRRGGYVLYFRHASTDFAQDDAKSRSFDDCANQRNLIDKGRDEARAIGKAIHNLRVPIGKVIASPLCRTMETARLAFGQADPVADVRGGPLPAADPNRYAALRKLLATPQPPGSNLVIVSHGNPFYGVAGPPYLAEGEAAVIRGQGKDDFEVIARIRLADWQTLPAAR
jgi:phosphohistidine phosphatase SixA